MQGLVFALAAIATALILGAVPAFGSATRPSGGVLAACAAFGPYALLCVLPPPRPRVALGLAFALTLAVGVALCRAPSTWSDDVYRHAWDGNLVAHGVDPYGWPPAASALRDLRDDNYARINHRGVPTVYPPLAQLLFGLGYRIHPGPAGQKLVAFGLHLLTVLTLWFWLRRTRPDDPALHARAVTLLALNPLALPESALSGHVDVAAGALVIAFVWALPRLWPALCAVVLLCALKLVGVLLAPLLWWRSRLAVFVALGLAVLVVIPVSRAGSRDGAEASGLRHYATRWRGNGFAFGVLEAGAATFIAAIATQDAQLGPGEIRLPALAPLLAALADTPLDLRPVPLVARKQARPVDVLPRAHAAGLLARLLALLLVSALVVQLVRLRSVPAEAARLVLFAVLLLSPQVHPWYLLWLLPLEIGLGRHAGLLWSALLLSTYASLDAWVGSRHWIEPAGSAPLQSLVVLAALLWQTGPLRPADSVDPRRRAV